MKDVFPSIEAFQAQGNLTITTLCDSSDFHIQVGVLDQPNPKSEKLDKIYQLNRDSCGDILPLCEQWMAIW